MWLQPSHVGALSSRHTVRFNGTDWLWTKLSPSFSARKLYPGADSFLPCTASLAMDTLEFQWIGVPCDYVHSRASYICERKVNMTWLEQPFGRMLLECPRRTLTMSGDCLAIYSTVTGGQTALDNVCRSRKLSLSYAPRFLMQSTSMSPRTEYEEYISDMFKAMNHRWPTLTEYGSILVDRLVLQSQKDSHIVALHFSPFSLGQIYAQDVNFSTTLGAFHVFCHSPLLPATRECLDSQSMCKDGTCILNHYVCDGVSDCPDQSDEDACSHVCSLSYDVNCHTSCYPDNCTCNDLYFQCISGGCVPWSRVCDGVSDCPHYEDEHMCSFHFAGSSVLVNITYKAGELQFGSDNATKTTPFTCLSGDHIPAELENDLVPDCIDQSDERSYYSFLKTGNKSVQFSSDLLLCRNEEETTCVKNFPEVCYHRGLYCIFEARSPVEILGCRNGKHLLNCKQHTCPSHFKVPRCLLHTSAHCM